MISNSYTKDEHNEFHPDKLSSKYKKIDPVSGHTDYVSDQSAYNDIDVIRAEMGQLRNWTLKRNESAQNESEVNDEKCYVIDKDEFVANKFPNHIYFAANEKNDNHFSDNHNDDELKRRKIFEEALFNEKLSALCLSGGGIRSASFCLGVLQALSKNKMLTGFDYISTVSGGGYIGGWLSAWASREDKDERKGIKAVEDALWKNSTSSSNNEFNEIFTNRECNEIINLRKYTNFLSPRIGFMSLDTRVFWITYLRNLFLNSLLFIPASLAFLAIVKFVSIFILYIASSNYLKYPHSYFFQFEWLNLIIVAYFMLHVLLCCEMMQSRVSARDQSDSVKSRIHKLIALISKVEILKFVPYPLFRIFGWRKIPQQNKTPDPQSDSMFLTDVKLNFTLYYAVIGITSAGIMTSPGFSRIITCEMTNIWESYYFCSLVISSGLIWLVAFLIAWSVQREPLEKNGAIDRKFKLIGAIIVGGMASGAIFFFGFFILNGNIHGVNVFENFSNLITSDYCTNKYNSHFENYGSMIESYRPVIYFGPLILIAADFVGSAIFSAVISTIPDMDDLQEWSARMLAWLFMLGGCWLLFSLIAIQPDWSYIPFISDLLKFFDSIFIDRLGMPDYLDKVSIIFIFASGIFAVIYGKSSKTSAAPQANNDKYGQISKALALLGGGIFLFMISLKLSEAFDNVVFSDNLFSKIISDFHNDLLNLEPKQVDDNFFHFPGHIGDKLSRIFMAFIILTGLAGLTSWFININSFSLHRYYRNRLIRSFLGSVNSKRNPDKFTDFDQNDNISMSKLTHNSPLLIINAALNLLKDENLSWQERKSSSFTFSRLFCGNKDTGYRPSGPSKKNNTEPGYGEDISLGTAMAISGAAVSPNMGYNSSPVITFLMTLFNARLGWWLGNPKHDSWTKIGPSFAIYYYIRELFGLTNDHCDYVYLSDGGHFENLGAYEMIRRCCRTIVIVDAGCDPDSKFEDLGKFIRLARIDFNVEITFNREFKLTDGEIQHFAPTHPLEHKCPPYCLVGEIEYRNIESRGTIIYIKPGVHGDEPQDVRSYHAQHPVFPHESTSDQFFSESQFESYRKLGLHIGSKVFKAIAI